MKNVGCSTRPATTLTLIISSTGCGRSQSHPAWLLTALAARLSTSRVPPSSLFALLPPALQLWPRILSSASRAASARCGSCARGVAEHLASGDGVQLQFPNADISQVLDWYERTYGTDFGPG